MTVVSLEPEKVTIHPVTMPSFWEKGPEIYEKALREEFQAAKARLKTQMRECMAILQRQALEEALEALKKDFRSRLRGMDQSLF